MINKSRLDFNPDHKVLNQNLLNQIAKVFQQDNINDLIELKNFADSMFNYLKDNNLLNDYLSWKKNNIKKGI